MHLYANKNTYEDIQSYPMKTEKPSYTQGNYVVTILTYCGNVLVFFTVISRIGNAILYLKNKLNICIR